MRYCLTAPVLAVMCGWGSASLWGAGSSPSQPPVRRVTAVVRADSRSGRLVRSVVVPRREARPRLVNGQAPERAQDRVQSESIDRIVERAAAEYGVDPLLVHSVIGVESNYNRYAISPKGAEGMMQLIPSTARGLGVKNSFDAEENIRAGVRHLKRLQERFKDDRLALAAYNAGAGAVEKHGWIPPYAETRNYVYQVGRRYGEARRATRQTPAPKAPGAKPEREHPPVESYVDAEGRLHLRTR